MTFYQDNNQGQVLESSLMQYARNSRDADSLKVRLETEDIKLKIATYLTGKMVVNEWNEKEKIIVPKAVSVGEPKVNQLGYQDIMSFVEAVVNKSVVQGNFPQIEDAYDYLIRIRKSYTEHLWINAPRYGIKNEEFKGMLNTIFALIEPFITRTIHDGERGTIRDTTIQQDRVIHGADKISFNPLKMFK